MVAFMLLTSIPAFVLEDNSFLEGIFSEGYGVSLYVNPECELCTIGNDWDLNDDSWLDAVIVNEFKYNQAGYETYSYVFWGGPDGFERTHCDSFFTSGAECAALADFDRDGWTDIVVANSLGESMHSYVIHGSPQGYTNAKIDSFPAKENHGAISVADLNRDGWLDLVWSDWFAGGKYTSLYWGNPQGFEYSRIDSFPAGPAHGNVVADFDNDGYADIFWAVYYETFDPTRRPSKIFWGDEDGYSRERYTEIGSVGPGDDVSVADLNKDGFLDIVIPNHSSEPPTKWTPYDYSYIHYGEGNRRFRLDSLYAYGPWASSVADIDGDGWLDIVFAYSSDSNSIIYYGSREGFRNEEFIHEYGVTCALLADFDNDDDCDMVLGKQARTEFTYFVHEQSDWLSRTWTRFAGIDAGVTKDLGNPGTRLDEAWYISPFFMITPFIDSVAYLDSFKLDYYTTWQGIGTPEGSYLDLWVSASPLTEDGNWGPWIKVTDFIPDLLHGRSFRYKICFHNGFRTSVVLRKVQLFFSVKSSEGFAEPQSDFSDLYRLIQISPRGIELWVGESLLPLKHQFLIYDDLGRRVCTLHPDQSGCVIWDGKDESGIPLPAGTYFWTIPLNYRTEIRKLILYR